VVTPLNLRCGDTTCQEADRILSAVPAPRVPEPGEIGVQGELRDGAALPVAANPEAAA